MRRGSRTTGASRKRLTINLGLRWDFNIPANERYNRMNRGFDLNLTNPVDQMIDRTKFPGFPTVKGGLLFAGVNGQPRNAADTYMRAIQPRFGFAYQLNSKLVVARRMGTLLTAIRATPICKASGSMTPRRRSRRSTADARRFPTC